MHLFICFTIWITVVSLIICRSYQTAKEAITHVKRLHKIPCSNCLYFTGEYRLKCTVHPYMALSEEAIDCRDFEACSRRKNYILRKNTQKKYCSCDNFESERLGEQSYQN